MNLTITIPSCFLHSYYQKYGINAEKKNIKMKGVFMFYVGKKAIYSSKYYDLGNDGMILLNGKAIDELLWIKY